MTRQELEDFVAWKFKTYDVDGTGMIDGDEAAALANDMGKTKEQIVDQLREFDDDSDSDDIEISLDELLCWFTSTKSGKSANTEEQQKENEMRIENSVKKAGFDIVL